MKHLIISPHTDDAIFSLGSYMLEHKSTDFTILSIYAGIPDDDAGKRKHTTLRKEHDEACRKIGAKVINGDFLDDVYTPRPTLQELAKWINPFLSKYNRVYVPMGIHHPDHVNIHNVFKLFFQSYTHYVYEELPYRILYPELASQLREVNIQHEPLDFTAIEHNPEKEEIVKTYKSQVGPELLTQLFVDEHIWKI